MVLVEAKSISTLKIITCDFMMKYGKLTFMTSSMSPKIIFESISVESSLKKYSTECKVITQNLKIKPNKVRKISKLYTLYAKNLL